MKYTTGIMIALLFFVSCTKKKPKEAIDLKTELMDADRAFSKLCEQKGMKNAFIEYIDSNGVLLRPNTLPLTGAYAVDFISQDSDSAYTMTWEPKGGSVAQSGELGYTYGIYAIRPLRKDTVLYGTYVSVWRKQADGKWKFVLDTGNEGIQDK